MTAGVQFPVRSAGSRAAVALLLLRLWVPAPGRGAEAFEFHELESPAHEYSRRPLKDRFTRLKAGLESGAVSLDRSGELAFVTSLLQVLEIPVSSQMLVFSTTSLQLSLISPSNPRALYFNEDVYVGWVPGGKIEVVSLDPELGAVFYIFEIPRGPADTRPLRIERSGRCMNCHSGEDTGFVPGLTIKSVVPGPGGGTLDAFRQTLSGHAIPLTNRFGGWHVTGAGAFTNHWGNRTGRMLDDEVVPVVNAPGERFRFSRYPVDTSDLLPQLLHEHQAGMVNRVVEAIYRTRTALHSSGGTLTAAQEGEIQAQAETVIRYLLFADEADLPPGGVSGDPAYRKDFLRNRRLATGGVSLKDLDLQTRLFRHRCSYMIYSPLMSALPEPLRSRLAARLERALRPGVSDPVSGHLPEPEKATIRTILRETLRDWTAGW